MIKKDLAVINEEIKELETIDYSPLNNEKLPAVTYGYVYSFKTMVDSLKKRPYILFTSGVLAGVWISIAYIACIFAVYAIGNASVQKLLIGCIFPLVLSLIYFIGGSFLTAYMSLSYPMVRGIGRWRNYLRVMVIVYAGNIVGSLFLVLLLELANIYGDPKVAGYLFNNLGLHKMYDVDKLIEENLAAGINWWKGINASHIAKTIMWVFFSAIICNMLVSLSSQANKATKGNLIGSIIMFWILIFMFAISGYQHSVANWFIAWSMLFIGIFRDVVSVNGHDVTVSVNIALLFMAINIIPAIFGNYLGAFIMGFLLSIFNHSYSKLLIAQSRLKLLKTDKEMIEKKLADLQNQLPKENEK